MNNFRLLRLFVLFIILNSVCYGSEIEHIRIELNPENENQQIKLIYDSSVNNNAYPFNVFASCLEGWGRKGGLKKANIMKIPKTIQPEGSYIIYAKIKKTNLIKKYRLMNFYVMQDINTGIYYETDLLQYLYGYLSQEYIKMLD